MIPGATIQDMLLDIVRQFRLHQLVEHDRFRHAADIARKYYNVDNLLIGSNDAEQLIVKEIIGLLQAGGLLIRRQWSSNCQGVLDVLPKHLREMRTLLALDPDTSVTALGLRWEPANDQLSFKPS